MTPDQLTGHLTTRLNGPHSDEATAGAARLAAEVIRFLNYATMSRSGGLTEPATVPALMGELSSAVYRLPQLFGQVADWLNEETSAGRLADDHGRPVYRLTDEARLMLAKAMGRADDLASALAAVQALTTSLHAAGGEEG